MADFVHPKGWQDQTIIMVGDHKTIILVGKVFQKFRNDHNSIILVKRSFFSNKTLNWLKIYRKKSKMPASDLQCASRYMRQT